MTRSIELLQQLKEGLTEFDGMLEQREEHMDRILQAAATRKAELGRPLTLEELREIAVQTKTVE